MAALGIVVIGRNEGERLKRCLQSITVHLPRTVYVDSGSTDESVQAAQQLGAQVLQLDMQQPFTAARARNAGFAALLQAHPQLQLIQFIDGDCEVLPGWLEAACVHMTQHPDVAALSGILDERFPDKSVYNRLCDMEWKMPAGEVKACGGNAMMRVAAFQALGGFKSDLIAGEEPELCVRLRKNGWKIWHLHVPMMLHDANMLHFRQWWRRSVRAGYAFANGATLHGTPPERHWVAEARRARRWGLYLPLFILLFACFKSNWTFLLALLYPLQIAKNALSSDLQTKQAWQRAFFLSLGKFAEVQGQTKFYINQWFKNNQQVIEYKHIK